MSKFCPIVKENVLYLECLECNERGACENANSIEKSPENLDSPPAKEYLRGEVR